MFNAYGNSRGFPIKILATPGGRSLAEQVDQQLKRIYRENGEPAPRSFIIPAENPRFQNGEGKGVIHETVRGTDLYVFVDVGNYGVTYTRNTQVVTMSPDEHYMDLIRLLGAAKNMAQRVNVIMPLLYEGRQHKMHGRESLDCALALQDLMRLGVRTLVTVDAHNSHVANAIPMQGIENLHATYQLISAFLRETQGRVNIDAGELVVCSPDLGGMERARYFAEHFRVHLTGFYKVRDLTNIVEGKNPVLEHKFLGADIEGKDVLVVDDLLASGGSALEVCRELKSLGARRIYLSVTYALFSAGVEKFDRAHAAGMFEKVIGTNATYVPEALRQRPWFVAADVSRFLAKFIHTFNQDGSVSRLLDSTERISRMLGRELPQRPPASSPGEDC